MAPTRSGPSKLAKRRGRPPGSRNSTAPHLSNSKVTKQQDRAGQSSVKRQRTAGAKGADREGAKKKRGRAARVSNAVAEEEVDELSFTQPKVVPKATGGPVEQAGSARTRRRPSGTRNEDKDANEEGESHSKARNYAQLAPRTRRIAREVMESWPVVSAQVMDQMIETLREAKKEVVNTQRDEQRAMAADETLGSMVRMLARQLSGSRIPPQAKDIHFNIDKLTERYGHLFRELSTERHSHQLLTEQVKVAQQLLKRDEARLEQVKKNAREWKVRWRQQERQGRLHGLLKDLDGETDDGDGPEDMGLVGSTAVDVSMMDGDAGGGGELSGHLSRLVRSVSDMQGNHEQQVAGMWAGIRKAQVALDEVVGGHVLGQGRR